MNEVERLTTEHIAELFDMPQEKVLALVLYLYHFGVVDVVLNVYENNALLSQRALTDGPPPSKEKYKYSFGVKAHETQS